MGLPSSRFLQLHRVLLLPPLVLLTLTCLYTSSTLTPFSPTNQHLSFLQGMQCHSCESSASLRYRSFLSRTLASLPTSLHIRGVVSGNDVLNEEDSRGEGNADESVPRHLTDEVESVGSLESNENNVPDLSSDQQSKRKIKESFAVNDGETIRRIVRPKITSAEESPVRKAIGDEEKETDPSRSNKKHAENSKVNADAVFAAGVTNAAAPFSLDKKKNSHGINAADIVDRSVPSGKEAHSSVEIVKVPPESKEIIHGSKVESSVPEGKDAYEIPSPVDKEKVSSEKENSHGSNIVKEGESSVPLGYDVPSSGDKEEIFPEKENIHGSNVLNEVESPVPAGDDDHSSVETVTFPPKGKNLEEPPKEEFRSTPLASEDHSQQDESAHTPTEKAVSATEVVEVPSPSENSELAGSGYGALSEYDKSILDFTDKLAKSGLPPQSVNSSSTGYLDVNVPLRGEWRQGWPMPERSCEGRRAYLYTLPSKFNVDLAAQCDLVHWFSVCDFFVNEGMGRKVSTDELSDRGEKVLVPDGSWYMTHQYALELTFHSRLKYYPCLTADVNQADLFFVPYYAGLDVARYQFRDNVTNEQQDELMLELMSWLEGQDSWSRNNGVDHVFVLGKIGWDFRRVPSINWGSKFLRLPSMEKPTKVLIERDPWHERDIGVPHPTFFHPKDDNEIRTWLTHVEQSERRSLVSFAGMPRPNMFGNVRGHLIQQCADHEDDCSLLQCVGDTCMRPDRTMNLFLHSHFCMQPPGDSSTRRSVFDSLVGGCIPVLFHALTAYGQYPWHLPRNFSSYSVYIPSENVISGKVDIVRVLKSISPEERTAMRTRIIREIIPGLLYTQPGTNHSDFRDAFDISMEGLFQRVVNLRTAKS